MDTMERYLLMDKQVVVSLFQWKVFEEIKSWRGLFRGCLIIYFIKLVKRIKILNLR